MPTGRVRPGVALLVFLAACCVLTRASRDDTPAAKAQIPRAVLMVGWRRLRVLERTVKEQQVEIMSLRGELNRCIASTRASVRRLAMNGAGRRMTRWRVREDAGSPYPSESQPVAPVVPGSPEKIHKAVTAQLSPDLSETPMDAALWALQRRLAMANPAARTEKGTTSPVLLALGRRLKKVLPGLDNQFRQKVQRLPDDVCDWERENHAFVACNSNRTSIKSVRLVSVTVNKLPEDLFMDEAFQLDLVYFRLFTGNDKLVFKGLPRMDSVKTLGLTGHVSPEALDSIGNMTQLDTLRIRRGRVLTLPDSFKRLTVLKTLLLEANGLDHMEVPPVISKLNALEVLILRRTRMTSLPDWLPEALPRLTRLDIKYNQLELLPENIGLLSNLEIFDFSSNPLRLLPESIGNLTKWGADDPTFHMDLSSLRLEALPESIGNLAHIRSLHVDGNAIKKVPASIGALKRLVSLSLSNNRITSLPESLGEIGPSLKLLDLQNNKLMNLPESIGNLTSLYDLLLMKNRLRTLPASIGNLQNLRQVLDLSYNQLEGLPESLTRLKLVELILLRNKLTYVPNLAPMKELTRVDVSRNRLKSIDAIIEGANMEIFRGKRNMITHLGNINATRLRKLDLSRNRIRSLEPGFGTGVPGLNDLGVSHNYISQLPDSLRNATLLGTILMANNRLRRLPEDMGDYPVGVLNIENNAIASLPASLHRGMLTELLAARNAITKLTEDHIPSTLNRLDLSHNRIVSIPARPLKFSHGSVNLRLDHNQITDSFSRAFFVWLGQLRGGRVSIEANMAIGAIRSVDEFPRRMRVSLVADMALLSDSLDRSALAVRAIGLEGSAIQWVTGGDRAFARHGETCKIVNAVTDTRAALGALSLRECNCATGFYKIAGSAVCIECAEYATCENEVIVCRAGYYIKWSSAGQARCVACPEGATCRDNTMTPDPGHWWDVTYAVSQEHTWRNSSVDRGILAAYQREDGGPQSDAAIVFQCRNSHACDGGVESTCLEGYTGNLCSDCSAGYYSSAHGVCEQCPSLSITITMSLLGLLSGTMVASALFFAASGKVSEKMEAAREMGSQSYVSMLGGTVTITKVFIAFVQVLVSLDLVFDVEWPGTLNLFDDLFGWANLDWLKSSSMECLWEQLGVGGEESMAFSYYPRLCFIGALPLLMSLLLLAMYGVMTLIRWRLMAATGKGASSLLMNVLKTASTRCVQAHLLIWTFVYLPVSSKALGMFLCDSFNGGQTYYLHGDLSVECYTKTYYAYLPVAVAVIAVYTIGFPLFVTSYSLSMHSKDLAPKSWRSSRAFHIMELLPLREAFSTLSKPYRDKYGYWDAVEMARKLLVTSAAMHLGSTPTFQLTVALMISFFAAILHFYCQPFKAPSSNNLAGINLILVYATMTLGLLRRLDVSEEKRALFGMVVLVLDALFCVALLSIIGWMVMHSVVTRQGKKLWVVVRRLVLLVNGRAR